MRSAGDIRLLAPRPLGDEWSAYTGVSAYGALRRAWRANALHRADINSVLGIRILKGDDVYARSISSPAIERQLKRLFPSVDTRGWSYLAWWPFDGVRPQEAFSRTLRECTQCAESGYHTMLFQMPGVTHCPWHGRRLVTACPTCGRPLQAGLREELPPGQCLCGHDLINYVQAVTGEARDRSRIKDYLEWSMEARGRYWLFAPEPEDPLALEALDLLLPRRWAETPLPHTAALRDGRLLREFIKAAATSSDDRHTRLSERSGLETFRPGTVCLPIGWTSEFRAVSRNLLSGLAPSINAAARIAGNDLPWTLSSIPIVALGNTLFMQSGCFERATLRTIARLASGLRTPAKAIQSRSDDPFSHWIRNHEGGPQLLERVLKRVLLRGYSDGARVALGRHVASLYDRPRGKPAVRFPWVLIHLPADTEQRPEGTIVWTRQAGTL